MPPRRSPAPNQKKAAARAAGSPAGAARSPEAASPSAPASPGAESAEGAPEERSAGAGDDAAAELTPDEAAPPSPEAPAAEVTEQPAAEEAAAVPDSVSPSLPEVVAPPPPPPPPAALEAQQEAPAAAPAPAPEPPAAAAAPEAAAAAPPAVAATAFPVPPATPPAPEAVPRGSLPPVEANVIVGMGRAMAAMQAFYAAKADFENSTKELAEDSPERAAAVEAVYARAAASALAVARANGGVYNKAAQFVASMQGGGGDKVVPPVFIKTLAVLTDRAPFRPLEVVDAVLREELGGSSAELFASFAAEPLAAASLAQVHAATLRDGRRVAVKVQYPELRVNMASDMAVFRTMGAQIKPGGMDLTWMVDDFEAFLTMEVDFKGEADNTEAAAALLADAPDVLVPAVVRELSTSRVLVTEFVDGLLRVDNPAALAGAGLRAADVGALLARTFADMALVAGRVHGDPHAGNVYVRPLAGAAASRAAAAAEKAGGVGGKVRSAAEGAAGAAAARGAAALRNAAASSGGGGSGGAAALALRAASALEALASALAPPAARPQLVLLDHGLYHTLDATSRRHLCALLLACAACDTAGMRSASEALARTPGSPLARFFPLVLSHWFVFGVGLLRVTPGELAAAREGRLPPGLTLTDLSDFLTGLHGAGGNILGVVHSLGYTRGLLHSLAFPERRRLRALAAAAARGLSPPDASPLASWIGTTAAEARIDAMAWGILPVMGVLAPLLHGVPFGLPADLAALAAFVLIALVAALAGALTRADHPLLI